MRQKIGSYIIDMVTGDEMRGHLKDSFARHYRDVYQGVSYPMVAGIGNGTGTLAIPGPSSGYAWAIKSLSIQASAATPVSVYLGENANTAPVGTGATVANGGNNECVIQWSSTALVLADERVITISAGTANILNWRIAVKQVPAEMTGKL